LFQRFGVFEEAENSESEKTDRDSDTGHDEHDFRIEPFRRQNRGHGKENDDDADHDAGDVGADVFVG
jgi:hypothetical protein